MELNSFREILLKKVEESKNPYLQSFIKYAKDDLIVERVLESLEKMARPTANMGRNANSAITAFAQQLTKADVEQIKDALSHHVSHYRGALKSGNRDAADKHLARIVPLMHLIARSSPASNGRIALDYRSTTPWETNYTTTDRHPHNNLLKEGTKDLRRRPAKTRPGSRGCPDWRYLEMAPHAGHADTASVGLPESGYPFEEIQVGSSDDIDQGKAWLPIDDVGEVKEYVPHPFDLHPIHEHADKQEQNRSEEAIAQFADQFKSWKQSEPHKAWMSNIAERFKKDPEAWKTRGTKKSGHFWEGLQLSEQPDHAKKKPAAPSASQAAAPAPEEIDFSALPESLRAKHAPTAAKPQAQPQASAPQQPAAPQPSSEDEIINHLKSTLTPEHIKKMTPEMKKILKITD